MAAALPSSERTRAPLDVRVARVGDDVLLAAAVAAAAEIGQLSEAIGRTGDALRNAEPAERTDVARRWDPEQAAGNLGEGTSLWWARAQVTRIDEAADLEWTLEVAADASGPFVAVASGRHDPNGYGDFVWDIRAFADAVGVPTDVDAVGVTYDERAPRVLEVSADDGRAWVAIGDTTVGWVGGIPLAGAAGTGAATVAAGGGWGEVTTFDETDAQVSCWDALGDTRYTDGTLGGAGDPEDCPFPYPFDP